ncbi:hypothetical protein IAQ61_007760 [Plenodomus lingam]|uniref:uncharacterized protein n=1 Tax=Leptosphaeria maculans TaxID=5022 RepID=UPI00332D6843|nr:hypothetical protein IAQ61_007760 [Plenodomus lingam]
MYDTTDSYYPARATRSFHNDPSHTSKWIISSHSTPPQNTPQNTHQTSHPSFYKSKPQSHPTLQVPSPTITETVVHHSSRSIACLLVPPHPKQQS